MTGSESWRFSQPSTTLLLVWQLALNNKRSRLKSTSATAVTLTHCAISQSEEELIGLAHTRSQPGEAKSVSLYVQVSTATCQTDGFCTVPWLAVLLFAVGGQCFVSTLDASLGNSPGGQSPDGRCSCLRSWIVLWSNQTESQQLSEEVCKEAEDAASTRFQGACSAAFSNALHGVAITVGYAACCAGIVRHLLD